MLLTPDWFAVLREEFAQHGPQEQPEALVGIESRGLIFGTVAAQLYACPLVMARKPGKLPGEVISAAFGKEYGDDRLEIQPMRIRKGGRYLVVDDILATGNTVCAVIDMLRRCGADASGVLVYGEIEGLGGRQAIGDYPVYSCVTLRE